MAHGLTHDVQVAELRFGRHRVDLAHVPAPVLLVHVVYMQIPCAVAVVLVVRDTDARVARDHVIVNGQNGGLLEVHPGDLKV